MAEVLLCLFFVTTFLGFVAGQQTKCSVSVGASLTATPGVTPWLSSSGDFAFGFRQLEGNDNFLLSIWYDKIPDKTIIWYPETNATVSRGSKVELIDQRGLVLTDPQGREVWSTSSSFSDLACGFMNDTGNFVILGNNSGKIWESFSYPADTLLPTQVMEIRGQINSKKNKTNFSRGRFQLRMVTNGNLVLNIRDIFSNFPLNPYYVSGTSDAGNSTNSGYQLSFDATGYMYILRRNGQKYDLTRRDALPSGDYYHRATLDPDGLFTQYYHPKNPTGNASWAVIWSEPKEICFSGDIGSGACGLNNVCSLDGNRPKCECPQGFSLLDSNDPNGDCDHDISPRCDEGYGGDLFDFIELNNTDWSGSDYAHIRPSNEENCKLSCREDCFCAVAIFRDDQCWKKAIPLSHGKKTSEYVKAFLKYQKDERPPQCPPWILKEKDQRSLVLVGSVLLGTCVFVIIVLTGVICLGFFLVYKKKPMNPYASSKAAESNLPRFTYQELVEATNGFKDELGKGAFGIVYKGVIGTNIVAVKKLDRVVEDGEKEFKTEVNVIARTHHKNLVQLLGYCDDGEQRLLVYEYMNNGTLAAFLFKDVKPSWKERSYIGVGIAKGLAYLHEECSTQIIHCDIKPQNILLDDYYNAKISDFGLAKLLLMNQSRTNTGIRGTKGYVAPEWFRNTPVTVKVDVFSYGVLLLEIISCQKSVVFDSDKEDVEVLTDWAWDCYHEGRVDAFVEDDMEGLDDLERVITFVKVGLWCVQENPCLRPTMRKVVQMLEDLEVTDPPCPYPLFGTSI
ncbi:Bulb-type lectin domain-containing protein [Cynara cardunculus var. scolymus]|uniref:Receptor-like serine/threonine-protein kinase n=1 Tax=Cynara cardunculus var. scolymus TaxID=59895 RepID=A0A103Y0G1_CYNCS|nr:Bulb-type lectin domain-containing protein [Cynara cardunculus var. scolymus]